MTDFSQWQGWLMIAVYGLLAYGVTFSATHLSRTKENFLVADRRVSWTLAAPSIAATWIWAPALFVAAEKAYTQGWPGVFWFTVPNILTLVIFGWFMQRLRGMAPDGFTLSGYIKDRFGGRTQVMYLIELGGLAACSFAVQLLAGAGIVTILTGIPFWQVTVVLALLALGYSLFSGINGSIVTDFLQMGFMALGVLIFVPWAIASAPSGVLTDGLDGFSGTFGSLFTGDGGGVAVSFGIAVTIGLLSGPFGDQSFYQRGFSVKRSHVIRSFMWGAVIFGIVPLVMSQLGFLAAGLGLEVDNTTFTNVAAVQELLPTWTLIPFLFILLSGLVSTLDSNLSAISSLAGHDVFDRWTHRRHTNRQIVGFARIAMLVIAVAAVAIANIPNMKVLYLFLFYGALRSSTLTPTVFALWRKDRFVSERGMFWGIVVALALFVPLFAYGNWNGVLWANLTGIIGIVVSSFAIAAGFTIVDRPKTRVPA